jgi:hypothetical protein
MKVLGNWCTIFAVLSLAVASQAAPKNNQPVVVPSLKTWTSGNGHLQLTHASRIVVDSKYKSENDQNSRMENPADLKEIATTLVDDLKTISSLHLNVVVGKPRKGDIYLELGELNNETSDEAYLMKVSNVRCGAIQISELLTENKIDCKFVYYHNWTNIQSCLLRNSLYAADFGSIQWQGHFACR